MRYLIRHTYQCKRGQGPVYLENLKVLLNILRSEGMPDSKVCVDVTSSMDMVVWDLEVDSLDQFYAFQRAGYVEPDEQSSAYVKGMNESTVSGSRDIFEILDL